MNDRDARFSGYRRVGREIRESFSDVLAGQDIKGRENEAPRMDVES